jgi:hypothetical protein
VPKIFGEKFGEGKSGQKNKATGQLLRTAYGPVAKKTGIF